MSAPIHNRDPTPTSSKVVVNKGVYTTNHSKSDEVSTNEEFYDQIPNSAMSLSSLNPSEVVVGKQVTPPIIADEAATFDSVPNHNNLVRTISKGKHLHSKSNLRSSLDPLSTWSLPLLQNGVPAISTNDPIRYDKRLKEASGLLLSEGPPRPGDPLPNLLNHSGVVSQTRLPTSAPAPPHASETRDFASSNSSKCVGSRLTQPTLSDYRPTPSGRPVSGVGMATSGMSLSPLPLLSLAGPSGKGSGRAAPPAHPNAPPRRDAGACAGRGKRAANETPSMSSTPPQLETHSGDHNSKQGVKNDIKEFFHESCVPQLFEKLSTDLLQNRPHNAVAYILSWLKEQRSKLAQDKDESHPPPN
ncbi:unnamed protein product [Phytomonas sp. Hart1]|nr:unnamed protein product [Phytomonas sp. Hart1]|eukprot:CCW68823.1 unnamed protein product [Phytomonas sp. isolate Hart1]